MFPGPRAPLAERKFRLISETFSMRCCSVIMLLVAAASAFSPAAPMALRSPSLGGRAIDRVTAPVIMAGWEDEYQDKNPGRKRQVCAPAHVFVSAMARV